MACEPTARAEVMHCAWPEFKPTAEHSVEVPFGVMSVKVTVPVGEAPPDTVAVKVSESPSVDGSVPAVRATAVAGEALGGGLTPWAVVPVEGWLPPSPE